MNDTISRDLVLARLEKDPQPEDEWSALVLATLEGCTRWRRCSLVRGFEALPARDLLTDLPRTGLGRACHHHPYELSPTTSELPVWIDAIEGALAPSGSRESEELERQTEATRED